MNKELNIANYENDIAAGRLIRLPCVVGDEVTYMKDGTRNVGICQDISWRGDRFTYGNQFLINVSGTSISERDIICVDKVMI